MKDLRNLYRIFMWQKVYPKMCLDYNEVLATGFVDNYYIVILKDKFRELDYTIIVDNIEIPQQIVIEAKPNKGEYHTFNVKALDRLPKKLKKALDKQGLFMTNKDRSKYSAWTSIHRLVCSTQGNCKGLSIHHIDKDKGNNNCCNLVPVSISENNEIEYLYTTLGEKQQAIDKGTLLWETREINKEEKGRSKKRYITDNDRLKIDIIKYAINHTTKEVIEKFNCFIKTPQTIRNILKYFFYKIEFIEWLNGYSSNLYSKEYIESLF